MARKPAAAAPQQPTRKPRKTARKAPAAKRAEGAPSAAAAGFAMPTPEQFADMSKMANMLTPEQAIELYKANARMALDVINAAIDSTAKLRKLQFEGEEEAREFHRKAVRSATEVRDAQGLVQAGQGVAQEALQKSMRYWGDMFDLITEIQRRLFTLMQDQMEGVPGMKQAKAAMALMPDVSSMKNVVSAMQGLVSSGGSTFETMQKMMSDMTRLAQNAMPGMKR
jgi:hypothetical protein